MTNNEPRTKRGHLFHDVLSALHKEIRRGNVKMACYWAAELYVSGFGPAAWGEMLRTSAEDCWGTATQYVIALQDEFKALQLAEKRVTKGQLLFIVKAAYLLAMAEKCRDVDNFICLVYDPGAIPEDEILESLKAAKDEKIPIPAYAHDKHTARGKAWLRKMGMSEKRMAERVIVKETAALKPRHKGRFDDLPGQIPVFTEEELRDYDGN
jgi:replication-associated recombination protein RarA